MHKSKQSSAPFFCALPNRQQSLTRTKSLRKKFTIASVALRKKDAIAKVMEQARTVAAAAAQESKGESDKSWPADLSTLK